MKSTLPPHRRRWQAVRTTGKVLFGLVLAVVVLVCAALGVAVAHLWQELPPLDKVTHYEPQQPLIVYTADGVPIGQFGAERRQFMPIAEIPAMLQGAVLAIEDTRFERHIGIDPIGIARAVLANLGGGMRQGASTITQQVARNFFLSPSRTLERKLKEALLALQIEQRLGKAQILELYMNQIYLGQRAYGFAAAAQVYFGKPLSALSIAESAMLAGLPQNPSYANPVTNLARARARQALVLGRMEKVGLITPEERTTALAEALAIRLPTHTEVHAEYLAEMARQAVVARFGETANAQGYRVYTTVRAAEQQAAYAALRATVLDHERQQPWRGPEAHEPLPFLRGAELERAAAQALRDHQDDTDLRLAIVTETGPRGVTAHMASGETVQLTGAGLARVRDALLPDAPQALAVRRGAVVRLERLEAGWAIAQWPQVQAAFVALEPGNGRLRALVGGFDFTRSPFNRATQAWRQAGSSIKPFLYSAALEQGIMPDTLVNDAPLLGGDTGDANTGTETEAGTALSGWQPRNADGRFDGPVTVRQGLVRSKNLVSLRLLQQIGLDSARDWIGRFGFDAARLPNNLTLALGSGSTTPLQLAQAYALLANGGQDTTPVFIDRITDAQGVVVFQPPPLPPHEADSHAIPARNAFLVNTMLQDVTRAGGTAAPAQRTLQRNDLYGKTGTTNDAVDAWFAGFQPGVVAVAWVGFDTPRSLGEQASGSSLALPIWIGFMEQALAGRPESTPVVPDGVVRVGDDWRYAEWALGGQVREIGLAPLPGPVEPPAMPASSPLPALTPAL
ncbi:PBP1A family penicillin-binding protein [Sphaerotilus sp.]|uniref:penicillin-binding protein 1A n=1 Tax=Sphaerotilus sp. TaxID=2093942 RepID=UPI002ACD2678|nr:PBP1A family penicillin-binding protein [Sphaerotilus sp.]MDZ7855690.1 PBP1A family penicillin-binding protein [Sphaerotilus sp.]